MKFLHEIRYDAAPADVHAMLTDPLFRERATESGGAFEQEVRVEPDGTGTSVLVDQKRHETNLPSIAQKIVGDTVHVVQREHWSDDANATLEVAIPGKPGHMRGTITLRQDGDGTVETVTADIKVAVPLVAGKLEKLIASLLEAALRNEQRVGEAWLRDQS